MRAAARVQGLHLAIRAKLFFECGTNYTLALLRPATEGLFSIAQDKMPRFWAARFWVVCCFSSRAVMASAAG
jgi:hypothetical protein